MEYVVEENVSGKYRFTMDYDDAVGTTQLEATMLQCCGLTLAGYTIMTRADWFLVPANQAWVDAKTEEGRVSHVNTVVSHALMPTRISVPEYNALTGPQQAELNAYVVTLIGLKASLDTGQEVADNLPVKPAFL